MKIEKYEIGIGRDVIRVSEKGKLSKASFPKNIADDNQFIKKQNDKYLIKIESPMEKSVLGAYEKYEEIQNVLTEELYLMNEMIWAGDEYPKSNKDIIKATSHVTLSFDEEFIAEEYKGKNNIYKEIATFCSSNKKFIEGLIGSFKLRTVAKKIIFIVDLDREYRLGIGEDTVKTILAICFAFLVDSNELNSKTLGKATKMYNLKADDAIKNKKRKALKSDFDSVLKVTEKYTEEGHNLRYAVRNHNGLVAATRVAIKDSIAMGVDYRILNEAKSVIEHFKGNHREYLIEGNKTDRDNYIFPIITDDKYIAKQVMKAAGLNVPEAIILEKNMTEQDIEERVKPFYNKKLVVKPRNTNYGTGITVYSKNTDKKHIMEAIKYAFEFDDNVLIEQYVKGMEYRFLVVDGKCISIAHRRAASVVGDGKSSIIELMKEKGKEPWHVLTGSPIKVGPPVEEFLSLQGLNYDTIVPEGKRIFVRKNSNCSTGGETIDYTDTIPDYFKRIAEKAAKAFNGKICGVDIIIDDINTNEYSIIEINDNPGYSINEWPYDGKGEKVGTAILKLLGF